MLASIQDKEIKTLLTKHGHKLHELELRNCQSLGNLDACPALRVLKFTSDALGNMVVLSPWGISQVSEPKILRCEHKHLSLVKIVISPGMVYVNCKDFPSNIRSLPLI
jgi:hypothetical protein